MKNNKDNGFSMWDIQYKSGRTQTKCYSIWLIEYKVPYVRINISEACPQEHQSMRFLLFGIVCAW